MPLVHILADAENSLHHPCLPAAFTDAFPNWACLIAAATIMLMVILDYLLQGVLLKGSFKTIFARNCLTAPVAAVYWLESLFDRAQTAPGLAASHNLHLASTCRF